MLFNSYIYFVFLLVILPIFYLLPGKRSKNIFLLICSYFFYGYWDWRFCSLLAVSTIVDFFLGLKLEGETNNSKRKLYLILSVIVNLSILGFFKYFNFFVGSFEAVFNTFGYKLDFLHLNIILPVGISFYTFQTMSYTLDIYRKRLKPTSNFIDFALFVSFFPQLVAGPIERASNLLPQLYKKLSPSKDQLQKGLVLIGTGLFRKVMIGDTAGRIVDHIFADLNLYSSFEILCGLILFSLQIYADFSGYSSIARGTSKLLGVELMKNFEQPYLSMNITEFWRRWHISLSSWLKDYLYISLGGNRKGTARTYFNLMLTMLLGGLWHGASWNFVIWGGLHGAYLAVHKKMLGDRKIRNGFNYNGVSSILVYSGKMLMTNILVLLTWLFFRAKDFGDIRVFFSKMLDWQWGEYSSVLAQITITYLLVSFVFDIVQYYTKRHTFLLMFKSRYITATILSVLVLVTFSFLIQSEPLPFVYFQF